jgi:hypothetical protein
MKDKENGSRGVIFMEIVTNKVMNFWAGVKVRAKQIK